MPKRQTRVIRVRYESPPDPDRFSSKERGRFVVVVLYPEAVKRLLGHVRAAKNRALALAREQIEHRLYKPPDLDALNASAEVAMVDLDPLRDAHRTLDDGTRVWLSEVERWLPRR